MKEQPKKTESRGIANFKPTPPTSQGKNYLFSIAIDDYHNFPKLHNCVKDASDISELLTDRYQFEKENVFTLYNEDATTDNIFQKFETLASKIKPIDNLVIYFAGHGEFKEVFKEGYWIPVNAAENRTSQFIPNSEIKTMLTAINTKHTFVIVDSCFSGSLFARGATRSLAERVERFPSRWGLTSGRSEIVADGTPGINSPFASSILYLLKNNVKQLGVQELCAHVIESVAATAIQTPIGEPLTIPGHKGGQFIFRLKKDEVRDWRETQEANTINAFAAFVSLYPNGKNIEEAKKTLAEMEEENLWTEVKEEDSIDSYMAYRQKYPKGKYIDVAIELVEDLEDIRDWKIACRKNRISAYLKYKRNYPNGDHLKQADEKIKALQNPVPTEPIITPAKVYDEQPNIQPIITPDTTDPIYEPDIIENRKNSFSSKIMLFGIPLFIILMFAISKFTDSFSHKNPAIESPALSEEEANEIPSTFNDPKKAEEAELTVNHLPEKPVEQTPIKEEKNDPKVKLKDINQDQPKKDNNTLTNPEVKTEPKVEIQKDNPVAEKRKAIVEKLEQNMIYLKGGSFAMGSSDLQDAPIHEVNLSRSFSISKTEVTQELWKAVMRNNPSSNKSCGSLCPVENVSYYEVQDFLKKLNEFTGKNYRLPTEAEWEYASIAGQSNDLKYQNPSDLNSMAFYNGNSQSIRPVNRKLSNKKGISDMLGNVAEWCEDWYAEDFYKDNAVNPKNKKKGAAASKVIRGGSFMSRENKCSIFYRDAMSPNSRKKYIGFRVVLN